MKIKIDFTIFLSPFFIIKQLQQRKFEKLSHYLRGDVLDIGCGRMFFKNMINCKTYQGLDLNYQQGVDLIGDLLHLPFREGSFDSIIMTEVLEHVFYPSQALEEAKKILRPGGYAYVTVPMTWGLHYEPKDFWRFTKYSLLKLVQDSGMEIIHLERIGGVFSQIGARFVDVLFEVIKKKMTFFSLKRREQLAIIATLPFSISFYYLGLFLDRIDKRDALGWVALIRKKNLQSEDKK